MKSVGIVAGLSHSDVRRVGTRTAIRTISDAEGSRRVTMPDLTEIFRPLARGPFRWTVAVLALLISILMALRLT
jgi:hypothetical protein